MYGYLCYNKNMKVSPMQNRADREGDKVRGTDTEAAKRERESVRDRLRARKGLKEEKRKDGEGKKGCSNALKD